MSDTFAIFVQFFPMIRNIYDNGIFIAKFINQR